MRTRQQVTTATKTSRITGPVRQPAQRRKAKGANGPAGEPFIEAPAEPRRTGNFARGQAPGETHPVHVELTYPSARRVCIAGSFNNWTATEMVRSDGGKWTIDLTLPAGAYEYRLVVDGQWMPDPNALRTAPNPFGEPNSLLIVPG